MMNQYVRCCPTCAKTLTYASEKTYKAAEAKKTICFSCRTALSNKNRDVAKEKNPAWKGFKGIPGKVLSKLKRDASKRGLAFELTLEDIYNVFVFQNKKCAFTNIPLTFGLDASVDRIDSFEGYYPWNIQIVHKTLNMMKKDLPNDVFIAWCKLVK
jgi:hypothetical protein